MADYTHTTTIILDVNDDKAQRKIKERTADLEAMRKRLNEIAQKPVSSRTTAEKKEYTRLTREIQKTEKELNRMQSAAAAADRVLGNISTANLKELRTTLRNINRELESGSIERGSDRWNELATIYPNLYLRAWRDKMIQIWQDRLDLLGVHDTGALRRSVQAGASDLTPGKQNLAFRFLEYGIYVDLGVGNGYRHDNGGDLEFLGKAYRTLHHMGKPRERRPWFNRSWYISVEVLKNHLANILGDQFAGAFDNLTDRQRG